MGYMTPEEQKLKRHLINDLLVRKGYSRYAKLLKDFSVELSRTVPMAAVCYNTLTVLINPDTGLADEDQLSMLIRHELLHVILQHQNRTVKRLALKAGLDPKALSRMQLEALIKLAYAPKNPNWMSKYTGPHPPSNFAGDWDLSRYYTAKDKEVSKEIGGLVLEYDHPEWLKLSFEDVLEKVEQENLAAIKQHTKRVKGSFDKNKKIFTTEDGKVYKINMDWREQ